MEALTTSMSTLSCDFFPPVSTLDAGAQVLASPPWTLDFPDLCEEHGESLSVFCLDDLEPLCKQCAAVSHTDHRVYPLTEAAADCKEELRTSVNGLKKRTTHLRKVKQKFEHASRHNRSEAKLTEEQMRREFECLHQFLREEESARLLALREKREEKKKKADEWMDTMNQVIASLEDKIKLMEKELDAGGDGVEYLEHYQDRMSSTWLEGREPQRVRRPLIDVAKHLGNLQYEVWEKMKDIVPYTPLTLDPRTAGQPLMVSPGLDRVYIPPGSPQSVEQRLDVAVPENPERFHPYYSILAREGFDSGVHCWDIEVGDNNNWTIGVAAQSLPRQAKFKASPAAGLWCISLRDGEYRALANPSQALNFDIARHLNRVRVRLDWDQGTLEFTNAETAAHLFTFRHRFDEKVYPYFESVSLRGGLAVLTQRVDISLGSDCSEADAGAAIMAAIGEDQDQGMNGECWPEGDTHTAATNGSSEMSGCGSLMEDKQNSAIGSMRREKKGQPQKEDQFIKTKPLVEEKTNNNKPAVRKQRGKPMFRVDYHVSLNRALGLLDKESASHKQIQINRVDGQTDNPRHNEL